ncbi:hypothetical protein Ccrd_020136, partial [Cynara cardunculus var. scolymus]
NSVTPCNFGKPNNTSGHCGAIIWYEERSRKDRKTSNPKFLSNLIVGDLSKNTFERDVIVKHRTTRLQRITDLHPSFMSMTYSLIHPYDEDGFRRNI